MLSPTSGTNFHTGQNRTPQTGLSSISRKIASCFSRCVLNTAKSIYSFCCDAPEGDRSRMGKFLYTLGVSTITAGTLLITLKERKGFLVVFVGVVLVILSDPPNPDRICPSGINNEVETPLLSIISIDNNRRTE